MSKLLKVLIFHGGNIMSLTKADIVERVYKEAGFSKEAADLVDMVFKVIKDTLSKGEKVKISGFGNFSIRDKSTRVGRNLRLVTQWKSRLEES